MKMPWSTRTRVILSFVVPCVVYGVMSLIALRNFDRPAIYANLTEAAAITSLIAGFVWLIPEYLAFGRKRPVSTVASLILPPLLVLVLFVAREEILSVAGIDFAKWLPSPWMLPLSMTVGLIFLARVFRLYAIPLGLVYVPAMWFTLLMVGYTVSVSYGRG